MRVFDYLKMFIYVYCVQRVLYVFVYLLTRGSFDGLGSIECALTIKAKHKTFTQMIQELNANTLAQIAIDQIEENDIVNILSDMYDSMPNIDPEDPDGSNRDYDRYFAANRISRANKSLLDKFKKIVYDLMRGPKGSEPCTKVIGTRMFKLYYNTSYTWQNLRLPEKPEEEKTDKDRQIEQELALFNELADQYEAAETALNILKQKKKASEETLAALMPNSKCIHRTPVMQVV